jgi:hypothetical protein
MTRTDNGLEEREKLVTVEELAELLQVPPARAFQWWTLSRL